MDSSKECHTGERNTDFVVSIGIFRCGSDGLTGTTAAYVERGAQSRIGAFESV